MFHLKVSSRNKVKLKFISSICNDYNIEKLDNNQWNCLWCGVTFQAIDTTKSLACVLGLRDMNVNICNTTIVKA